MTALASLKEPEPEDLSTLQPAELAKLLYSETRGSARAMRIYQALVSRLAVDDMKKEMGSSKWKVDREKGPARTKTNAQKMRDDWCIKTCRLLLIGYMTRQQLIETLSEDSKGRYRGKHGEHIEASTVERWLTIPRDLKIRLEVDRLRRDGITAATFNEEVQKQTLSRVL